MFRIGEFSKLTQVSIRMLRYYDETGLLHPAAVDSLSGYRLYAAEQIPRLNQILFFRDLNFSVSEIAEAINLLERDGTAIDGVLERKALSIKQDIQSLENKLAQLDLARKDLLQERMSIHYNVRVKSVPAFQVFSLRRVVEDYYAEGQLWKEMAAYAKVHELDLSKDTPTFTIYHDKDYREQEVDIEVCAITDQVGESEGAFVFHKVESVPLMACSMVYGPFENIKGAYLAMAGWLGEHNQYEMVGQSRQIVHRGPWNEEEPERYLTEIQIPLQEKKI